MCILMRQRLALTVVMSLLEPLILTCSEELDNFFLSEVLEESSLKILQS